MSTTSLQLRSVNLFLGALPSREETGPRSQWEVLPGITGTIQGRLREQLVLVGSLVVSLLVRHLRSWAPQCRVNSWQKDLMFDGG